MGKRLWRNICYYGYTPEVYASIKEEIQVSNRKIAHGFCVIAAFLVVAAYLSDPVLAYFPAYLIAFCSTIGLVAATNGAVKRYEKLLDVMLGMVVFIIEAFSIYISVFLSVDSRGVIVPVGIILLGIILTGYPLIMTSGIVVIVLLFSILSYQVKIPYYAYKDMVNAVIFGCVGVFFHYMFSSIRVQQILDGKQTQILSAKYKDLYDTVQCGLFECESDGEYYTFSSINHNGLMVFGYSEEEFLDNKRWRLKELFFDAQSLKIKGLQLKNSGEETKEEVLIRRKDGTTLWVLGSLLLVEEKEGRRKYICSCIDVDERKKAEDANQAKTQFLSDMSHDIRTPMNAIINMTRIAREDYKGISNGDVLDDLAKIETASDFLMGLINDILDVSRIENGRMELHPEVYEQEEYWNYMECIFRPLCQKKGLNLVIEKGERVAPVYVDKIRFNQIFFNVLSNAVKYTPKGGTIYYKEERGVITDEYVICNFTISDTGCGMSEEFQKKMLLPFERENNMGGAYNGTGLGLTIVKNIVNMMEGILSIESKVDEGTTVKIHLLLPFATKEQIVNGRTIAGRNMTDVMLEGRRILVTEDNELNMTIIERLLVKEGILVEKAENGQEAIERIEHSSAGEFDAILMDVRMPIMDGLEATRRIRALPREDVKTIPIIALTANAFEEDRKLTREAGMSDFLTKPVNPVLLYETIQKHIDAKHIK